MGEGVQEIKYKLDLLKDDMNLVQNEERKMEMYNPQAPIADQIDELLRNGSAAKNISRSDIVFGGRKRGLEDKFSVIVIGTSDLRTRARGVMDTANIMQHKRKKILVDPISEIRYRFGVPAARWYGRDSGRVARKRRI